MVDSLFQQTNYQASKVYLDAVHLRHEAIAANLANAETPNYKRVDLDTAFEQSFIHSLSNKNTSAFANLVPTVSRDENAKSNRADGNTVELEKEMLALNKNTLQQSFITDRISGTMARLELAITGRA